MTGFKYKDDHTFVGLQMKVEGTGEGIKKEEVSKKKDSGKRCFHRLHKDPQRG